MVTDMMDRFLGWVFILGMVVFLAALVFMLAMGYDPWTIAWISVLTGSVIGMTAGMVVMIKSFAVDGQNGSSS
ncbi:MAG: hypothetical protein KAJ35_02980 [Thermoplasmata archaeon]|nr:hypothetical protein [Thermoplasmata archaeon]